MINIFNKNLMKLLQKQYYSAECMHRIISELQIDVESLTMLRFLIIRSIWKAQSITKIFYYNKKYEICNTV